MISNTQEDRVQDFDMTRGSISALKELFGFDRFLPGQHQVIEHLLAGRSTAAVFPTGGGKSLCYQLPALLLPGLTLVVSPLIALMKDQIDVLISRGIAARRLDSSLTKEQHKEVMEQIRAGTLRLLYVAPERFNNERFRESIARVQISLFAVDEAHCISEWGHNFRPDYLKIAAFAQDLGAERILALTATATPKVLDDMCRAFDITPECAVHTPLYRPNLTLLATPVTAEDRYKMLLSTIHEQPPGPTIVYVTLQRTAETLAEQLRTAGLQARPYHAGMKDKDRNSTQDWFMSARQAIVVATIAFGMGVDKADIRYVYHYNLPKSLESYTQEIGRAGRDGEPSRCHVLVCLDDLNVLESFAYGDTPSPSAVEGLVREIFSDGSSRLELSFYELSKRHDIRLLVLRTLMTYLELAGYLEEGTPYYSEYRFKPIMSSEEILSKFTGERRDFLAALFEQSVKARTWIDINPSEASHAIGTTRERVIRALDWLGEQKMLELKVAGIRHRYRKLKVPSDHDSLARSLERRLHQREVADISRLGQVLEWAGHDGCQTAFLLAHFGEELARPCGHCTWCLNGPSSFPERRSPGIDTLLWRQACALRDEHRAVLEEPRSFTRFLCGIRSPHLSRAKLTRHFLFGAFGNVPFGELLKAASKQT